MQRKNYPEGAVGREITTNVPMVGPNESIDTIRGLVKEFAKKFDSINYIYVVNPEKKLLGVVSVKELLREETHLRVKEIMTKKLVVTHAWVNRKRVAYLAIKHAIKAVPVLDSEKKFVGVLTSDALLAILHKEHTIETYRAVGVSAVPKKFATILDQGILRAFLGRMPWIVIGLFGGMFTARLIHTFEQTLAQHMILASFIPLIVYIGNAVGVQVQTFFVRDTAFLPTLPVFPYALKQLLTSICIGIVCAFLVWLIILGFWQESFIGFVIGFSTFTAIVASTIIAILIPYLFSLLRQDPAIGSGPFATILQDLLSIFVYFSVASFLL